MAEKRRTIGDALSPEKLAFIKGEESAGKSSIANPKAVVRTIELASTDTDEANKPELTTPRTAARRQRLRSEATLPNASEVLDDLLVPLTTRIPHRLVQSLRRMCLEQRLRHAKPDSIQEIVEVALDNWVRAHGQYIKS